MKNPIENSYHMNCPDALPVGLIDYTKAVVATDDKVILYKKGNTRGRCYICGSEIRSIDAGERFKQGYRVICPECGTECWCILEGGAQWKAESICNVATIQKGKDGKGLFIRQWNIIRGEDPGVERGQFDEIGRFALMEDDGRWFAAKWVKQFYYQSAFGGYHERNYWNNWTRDDKITRIFDGVDYFFIPENWDEIVSGTPLQYCPIRNLVKQCEKREMRGNPIRWLLDFCRYPVIEKLYKAGYTKVVGDIEGYCSHKINIQAKTIQDALHLPLWVLRFNDPGKWTSENILYMSKLYKLYQDGVISQEQLLEVFNFPVKIEYYEKALGHASLGKIHRYLMTLVPKEEGCHARWTNELIQYRDYLDMCIKADQDLDDKAILFPEDLRRDHDRVMARMKNIENKKLSEKIGERAKKLEVYCFDNGMYLIRPASDYGELNIEGKTLHHCVATYGERMAKGETAIFFIRKIGEEDRPFYTLELRDKAIVQCRTKNNQSYIMDPAVKAFVELWYLKVVKRTA